MTATTKSFFSERANGLKPICIGCWPASEDNLGLGVVTALLFTHLAAHPA
jgi:hypothetical protein